MLEALAAAYSPISTQYVSVLSSDKVGHVPVPFLISNALSPSSLVEIPFHALHFVVILLGASCLVMILWEHLHDPFNHRLFWFVMVTRTRTSQTLSQPLMRRTPMSFASCPSRISPSPKSRLIAFPRAQNERHGVAAAALSLGLHRNITHLLPVFYWLLSLEPHTSH